MPEDDTWDGTEIVLPRQAVDLGAPLTIIRRSLTWSTQ